MFDVERIEAQARHGPLSGHSLSTCIRNKRRNKIPAQCSAWPRANLVKIGLSDGQIHFADPRPGQKPVNVDFECVVTG